MQIGKHDYVFDLMWVPIFFSNRIFFRITSKGRVEVGVGVMVYTGGVDSFDLYPSPCTRTTSRLHRISGFPCLYWNHTLATPNSPIAILYARYKLNGVAQAGGPQAPG